MLANAYLMTVYIKTNTTFDPNPVFDYKTKACVFIIYVSLIVMVLYGPAVLLKKALPLGCIRGRVEGAWEVLQRRFLAGRSRETEDPWPYRLEHTEEDALLV